MKNIFAIIAATCAAVASLSVAQAQPYYLAGNFEGWCNNCTVMTDNGLVGTNGLYGAHQWEYDITGQTPNAYDSSGMKVTDGTWVNNWPGANMNVHYDASGDLSVYYYPGTFSDGWLPTANRVGYSDTGASWELTGAFTTPQWGGSAGTSSDPNAQMTLVAGSAGVYTNIYTVAVPGSYQYKFRTTGTWNDQQAGTDFSGNPGNLAFTTVNPNQVVTFTLDLPNGRLSASVPPVYANVQFSVDMTLVAQTDPGFDPTSVTINGDTINAWGGTTCTNDPSAANANIYYSPYFSLQVGTTGNYQFRYLSSGTTKYDAVGGVGGNNRTLAVPNVGSTNVPTVFWDDAQSSDVLTVATTVTFQVNMTNAVDRFGVPFNPDTDRVMVDGDFTTPQFPVMSHFADATIELDYPGNIMNRDTDTGLTYSLSVVVPAGNLVRVNYKYGILRNAGSFSNTNIDNEAGFAQNHTRYIRVQPAVSSYNFPQDIFGEQILNPAAAAEPAFGQLTIGGAAGGQFPINWLGLRGVHLQFSTNLLGNVWQDLNATDGTGSTNWPATDGTGYFRLVQPQP